VWFNLGVVFTFVSFIGSVSGVTALVDPQAINLIMDFIDQFIRSILAAAGCHLRLPCPELSALRVASNVSSLAICSRPEIFG